MDKKRILIVDDEKEIADLVEILMQNDGYDTRKFYRGLDAFECVCAEPIDLAILDVMLPDTDGFTLCRKIREKHFFPIIMLTAKVEDEDKVDGLTIGADDYMTKPFNSMELLARVRGLLRRTEEYNRNLSPKAVEIYRVNGLEVNAARHSCTLYDAPLLLTPIEFEILLYLCRHMDMVVKSEELFEAVWKEKYLDSNNTVFVHIARIREKMGEDARAPRFIKTVWGVGYKLESEG